MSWRRWNAAIHRDAGYLCVGLTLIYGISGVAVNHMDAWNPSYRIERVERTLEALPMASGPEATAREVLRQLAITTPASAVFQAGPESLQILVGRDKLVVDLASSRVTWEKVQPRPLLRPMNFLHLNHPKRLWTLVADLYAVALMLLAGTGLFMLRGRQGITGRGGWLTGAGLLIPLLFLISYYL
ncbi:MAG: PepSY-associated TM helix domain-containing protein [Thermodesulfobacteriota bacterium]